MEILDQYKKQFEDKEKILTIISLGVGVQSSCMALMAAKGELPMPDCAIFADTGYEPKGVYEYLEYLKKILPFPVYVVSNGNIKKDIIPWIKENKRMPNAPFFTKDRETGKKGMLMRQCTFDYKIVPIKRKVRELCGITKGKHFPKTKYVEQWIGISTDEIVRMKQSRDKYIYHYHPLIEKKMNRNMCLKWMQDNKYILPTKSACVFCPYHDDAFWLDMKNNRVDEWNDCVALDKFIRQGNKNINSMIYLHRSCVPLNEVDFKEKKIKEQFDFGFNNECEGMCGV